jgi:hypothetical protein
MIEPLSFSNRSKDSNIYDVILLVFIVLLLEHITRYLKDKIPKYVNKLYTKFSNNSIRNNYSNIETNFNERHTPRNIVLEYQARTPRRYIYREAGEIDILVGMFYQIPNRRNIPAEFLPILLPDFVEEDIEIPEDAICGITFERPDCRTSCSHYFCKDAITTWLKLQKKEGRKMTCPSCRSIITKVSLAQEN